MENENSDVKELRVRDLPQLLHLKIERYISIIHARTGRELNKQTATIELIEKATRNIKVAQ